MHMRGYPNYDSRKDIRRNGRCGEAVGKLLTYAAVCGALTSRQYTHFCNGVSREWRITQIGESTTFGERYVAALLPD